MSICSVVLSSCEYINLCSPEALVVSVLFLDVPVVLLILLILVQVAVMIVVVLF